MKDVKDILKVAFREEKVNTAADYFKKWNLAGVARKSEIAHWRLRKKCLVAP